MAHRGRCEYAAALEKFDWANRIYIREADDEGTAFVHYGRGGTYRFLGRFEDAVLDLEDALEQAPDAAAAAFTRMARGGLFRMMGRYEESLDEYRKAQLWARRKGDRYATAYSNCGIGNAYRMMGRRERALEHLRLADDGYMKMKDIVARPYTMLSLGLMKLEVQRTFNPERARKLFRRTQDQRGMVYADLVEAIWCIRCGVERSKPIARALAEAERLGLRLEAAHARYLRGWPMVKNEREYDRLGAPLPSGACAIP